MLVASVLTIAAPAEAAPPIAVVAAMSMVTPTPAHNHPADLDHPGLPELPIVIAVALLVAAPILAFATRLWLLPGSKPTEIR